MNRYVIVVFPDEAGAYKGMQAFKDLHTEGSLTLYGVAVVSRDTNGVSVKQTAGAGPLGMGVGAMLGGLVGLFGGPAGAAIGLSAGATAGGFTDLFNLGVGSDFLTSVSQTLMPGKTAVVAEVAEDWVTPLDTRMEAIGGTVIREARSEFEDAQIENELNAQKADLAQMRAEFQQASVDSKDRLKKGMDKVQSKLKATADRAQRRSDQLRQELEAKLDELEKQDEMVAADAKARIKQNISDLRDDHNRRIEKLKQLWERSGEDLVA